MADVDSGGSCAWGAAAERVIPFESSRTRSCTLADLVPDGEGARALLRCVVMMEGVGEVISHVLYALDRDGAAVAQFVTVGGAEGLTPRASFAFEPLSRRGAILEVPSRGATRLWRLEANGRFVRQAMLGASPDSFMLAGHHHLQPDGDGYSLVADQVRALWGVSLAHLTVDGAITSVVDLQLPVTPVPYQRTMLSPGRFAMSWSEHDRATDRHALRLRIYRQDGSAVADAVTLDAHAAQGPRTAVAPAGARYLAAWETLVDTLPPVRGVALRPLDARGTPTEVPEVLSVLGLYLGGLDATATHGDVLLIAAVNGTPPTVTALVASRPSATRPPPFVLARIGAVDPARQHARIVATPGGALAAFQRDATTVGVVALTCAR